MESNSKKIKFWDLKPFWCQPWSIISFGALVLIFSWTLFSNFLITSIFGFLVFSWWFLFLLFVPRSYEEMLKNKES